MRGFFKSLQDWLLDFRLRLSRQIPVEKKRFEKVIVLVMIIFGLGKVAIFLGGVTCKRFFYNRVSLETHYRLYHFIHKKIS